MVSHSTCMPWTMNNLGNDYFPFNDDYVILICNAGCSQSWWAETRSKWRRWAVEWAGSSQWGGEELKMGQRLVTKLASRADRSRASEGVEQEAVNGDEIGWRWARGAENGEQQPMRREEQWGGINQPVVTASEQLWGQWTFWQDLVGRSSLEQLAFCRGRLWVTEHLDISLGSWYTGCLMTLRIERRLLDLV